MTDTLGMQRTELNLRKAWTLALLGELVHAGRTAGWLRGDAPTNLPDSTALRDEAIASGAAESSPMWLLGERLGLSPVARDALWFLACIELEPQLAQGAQLLVASGLQSISVQILEKAIGNVVGPLAKRGLVETSGDILVPMYRRTVRVHDRVLDLACGELALDPELADIATLVTPQSGPIPDALTNIESDRLALATGAPGTGRTTLLCYAIAATGRRVVIVRSLAADRDKAARQALALARECQLHDASPLFVDVELRDDVLREFIGPVFATARDGAVSVTRPALVVPVSLPDRLQREELWRAALPAAPPDVPAACAARYAVSAGLIRRIASTASSPTVEAVQAALRAQLERPLAAVARRIETRQTWDDLVLPVDQYDLLLELVARVRHRDRVLDEWGFADKVGRGIGTATLLSGPPGTGKTMIAGLVARELGLDLYQVDLARIASKYVGETEKQLGALFDAAEAGHAILLFDEADALFGKRTDVSSSNDRYANLEVNYLLQRMESFTGISMLTTNHETAIDSAFLRRLAFHIRVPMPDEEQRAALWRAILPARANVDADIDVAPLAAEFVMSGGYIRNAALRAAYLAADTGVAISQMHLMCAARREYEAMGKVVC